MKNTNLRRRRFFFDLKKKGAECNNPESPGRKPPDKPIKGDDETSKSAPHYTTA